jgi:hypothetical protein
MTGVTVPAVMRRERSSAERAVDEDVTAVVQV